MSYKYFDGDTFERNGRTFTVEHPYDECSGTPWLAEDGHGIVSEWKRHPFGHGTKPPKAPGERILVWDHGMYRTYDVQATMAIARRDGWGLGHDKEAELAQSLGRAPTKGEIIAAAVDANFEYLRRWCNNDWQYVGVVVRHVDSDESESLWGIESDAYDHLAEVAHELADEINSRLDDEMAADITASRPDMYQPQIHG